MAGVRIQHPTARSVTLTLASSRPLRGSLACQAQIVVRGELRPCARIHTVKTYHLNLDQTGAVIVSAEVWDMLQRIPSNTFRVANEVARPPDQVIHVPTLRVLTRSIAPGARHAEAQNT